MNLESDKRLNIQLRLDFSSAPTGEARQALREDIESLPVVHEPERPANTSGIMEEVCERANLKEALRQVRSCKGNGIQRSPNTAMGSDRVGRRITPWLKRSNILRKATDG